MCRIVVAAQSGRLSPDDRRCADRNISWIKPRSDFTSLAFLISVNTQTGRWRWQREACWVCVCVCVEDDVLHLPRKDLWEHTVNKQFRFSISYQNAVYMSLNKHLHSYFFGIAHTQKKDLFANWDNRSTKWPQRHSLLALATLMLGVISLAKAREAQLFGRCR